MPVYQLDLVRAALDALDNGEPLSIVLGRAVRIARLADDLEAVYWLELEQRGVGAEAEKQDLGVEIRDLRTQSDWKDRQERLLSLYIERRSGVAEIPGQEDTIMGHSVAEIEEFLGWPVELQHDPDVLVRVHTAKTVLARIRAAVYRYLSRQETSLADPGTDSQKEARALVAGIDDRLSAAARSLASGDFDLAVHDAYKRVEIAVREAGTFPLDLVGKGLVTEAFRPAGDNRAAGILADPGLPPAEQEAMMSVFRGAIGLYRNPASHRDHFDNPREVARLLLHAESLLEEVDKRRRSLAPPSDVIDGKADSAFGPEQRQ